MKDFGRDIGVWIGGGWVVGGGKITNMWNRHERVIKINCPRNLDQTYFSRWKEKKKKVFSIKKIYIFFVFVFVFYIEDLSDFFQNFRYFSFFFSKMIFLMIFWNDFLKFTNFQIFDPKLKKYIWKCLKTRRKVYAYLEYRKCGI